MVLRASGEKDGKDFDLDSVVGSGDGDAGVLHGKLLLSFAEAAGTAASFNSVVRVADATGIPIDEFKADDAREILNDLGVEDFSSGP